MSQSKPGNPNLSPLQIVVVTVVIVAVGAMIGLRRNLPVPAAKNTTAAPPVIFSVPALAGKDITQVIATLGTANDDNTEPTALNKQAGITEWNKAWKRGELRLEISYAIATGKVSDYFVSKNVDRAIGKDELDALLPAVGLTWNSPDYSLKPVKAPRYPGQFTGVIITPA